MVDEVFCNYAINTGGITGFKCVGNSAGAGKIFSDMSSVADCAVVLSSVLQAAIKKAVTEHTKNNLFMIKIFGEEYI